MVNRDNYHIVRKYLEYLATVQQRDKQTVDRAWVSLRHLLEWADSARLVSVRNIRPTLPAYLAARGLSHESISKGCESTRALFVWLKEEHTARYERISESWLETLRPAKRPEQPNTRDIYTLDDVLRLCHADRYTVTDIRDQAAIALLFLSGMRVWAFTTMPIKALDLSARTVQQWPELGVRTKNGKRATTYMLDIQDLITVALRWDDMVRAAVSDDCVWYAPLLMGDSIVSALPDRSRKGNIAKGLRILCDRVGLVYKSPHKLRHGHAVYALELARDPADLKAISQNLMHKDLKTTDGIYNILRDDDVSERIGHLK